MPLDPFERTDPSKAPPALADFFAHEFWRFVFVQKEVEAFAKTFEESPPMQKGATFNIDNVKEQVRNAINSRVSQ